MGNIQVAPVTKNGLNCTKSTENEYELDDDADPRTK